MIHNDTCAFKAAVPGTPSCVVESPFGFEGSLKLSQFQHLCSLYGWPCIGSQRDREQTPQKRGPWSGWVWALSRSSSLRTPGKSKSWHPTLSRWGRQRLVLPEQGTAIGYGTLFLLKKCTLPGAKRTSFCIWAMSPIVSHLARGKHSLHAVVSTNVNSKQCSKTNQWQESKEKEGSQATLSHSWFATNFLS